MSDDLLNRLKSEITYEKLSVSFSLENRDASGMRRFASFSVSVGKPDGSTWSPEEMPIVKALVSKQVVKETYQDAVLRRIIPAGVYREELPKILEATDKRIQRLVERVEDED